MHKEIIRTDQAPAAIGPYSQAVKANGFLFVSGQIPIQPETGDITQGNIENQTVQVLENLKAVLAAAGCGLENVVKTTLFIRDMNEFAVINKVYGRYFVKDPPARATVEVSRLPKDVDIEIEAVAVL